MAACPLDYFADEVGGFSLVVGVLGDMTSFGPCVEVLARDGDALLCEDFFDGG